MTNQDNLLKDLTYLVMHLLELAVVGQLKIIRYCNIFYRNIVCKDVSCDEGNTL